MEILIAVTVGVILISAAMALIIPILRSTGDVTRRQVANALAKELLEHVRVMSEGNWHALYSNTIKGSANHYYVDTSTTPFAAVSPMAGEEGETVSVEGIDYTRYFYVDDVLRDGSGAVVESGGTEDPSTQKVTVVVSWEDGRPQAITQFLTRSRNRVYVQTDWSGGDGQVDARSTVNHKFSNAMKVNYSQIGGIIIDGY